MTEPDPPTVPSTAPELAVRLVVLTSSALWLGGLCFYALVVVPSAHDVMGGAREAGFLTRRVTVWLNVIAAATLVVLLAHVLLLRRTGRTAIARRARGWLAGTWAALALLQVALFVLHPVLDRLLDPNARQVLDEASFYALHRVYLLCSTAQLGLGLAHVAAALAAWRSLDRQRGPLPIAPA